MVHIYSLKKHTTLSSYEQFDTGRYYNKCMFANFLLQCVSQNCFNHIVDLNVIIYSVFLTQFFIISHYYIIVFNYHTQIRHHFLI